MSKLENTEALITEDAIKFGVGDDFADSEITYNRDTNGFINTVFVRVKEKTDRTPFTSTDFTLYECDDVLEANIDSDFQVLKASDGLVISPVFYTLRNNGQLVFSQAQEEDTVLINGLEYTKQKTYYLLRDEYGRITQISMQPFSEVKEQTKQPLHPFTFQNGDVLSFYGKAVENLSPWFSTYQFDTNTRYNTLRVEADRTAEFFMEFPEPLILSDLRFDRPEIETGKGTYFSFDIWGSNDGASFQRLAKYRNLDNTFRDAKDKSFHFQIANPRAVKIIRINILDWANTFSSWLAKLQLEGYHPKNKQLHYVDTYGRWFQSENFNGKVKITTNNTSYSNFAEKVHGLGGSYTIKTTDYIQWEFAEPLTIYSYRLENTSGLTGNPKKWRLLGSLDGINWITQDSQVKGDWTYNKTEIFNLPSPRQFKYYKLVVDEVNGGGNTVMLGKIGLHGEV